MKKLTCSSCESIFHFKYDPEDTMDRPHYCPFCGEKVSDDYDSVVVEDEGDWTED